MKFFGWFKVQPFVEPTEPLITVRDKYYDSEYGNYTTHQRPLAEVVQQLAVRADLRYEPPRTQGGAYTAEKVKAK
jgi:hypothetical protein